MRKIYIGMGVLVLATVAGFAFFGHEIGINNGSSAGPLIITDKNAIAGIFTGQPCENATARPLAVMLSSDPEARPLSGIGQADLVFEMPVVGAETVTRMMAVFQCSKPKAIGSIRSSRLDFIPLVRGLGAIYAHFGGEHEALAELNKGVTDNIDGLIYDGTTYYRTSAPRPHNSLTSYDLLMTRADGLGYTLTLTPAEYYKHTDRAVVSKGTEAPPDLYAGVFGVSWTYDAAHNTYQRVRGGKPEIDKNTGNQVTASNIIIMHTTYSVININYNRVKTVGTGAATVYQNGIAISGTWKKTSDTSKLLFLDTNGKEILLVPGTTWVEITTQ
ncbi:MAG: hypothetical protein A3A33_00080 [Candidatus Yanofskybacteria bacterium RIFCSPLOWO2_01_FULL_49_25]|uniref:DUF3048 domain-containing protein n=1 Tax=Candidatus Yanofskybacteria bacterium RIFCSPLOWO2_01_FULL_49_25 TaxID=1802701 RepID=A0A1F8GUD4_9BACT|nr:MAG: hypothetical protein A3A33_00080 [Candidatus Yanofskybacteria bacterium RIFCSPLOWO2_01_FULL_49_25]